MLFDNIDGAMSEDIGRSFLPLKHRRITARHAGACARCGAWVRAGSRMAHYGEGWSHVACPRVPVCVAAIEGTAARLSSPLVAALRDRQRQALDEKGRLRLA